MRVDVISDVICPWCFIGKRRLERALAARPDLEARVTWRPFQLNPDMPPEGLDREHYLVAKFGSPEEAARRYAQIAEAGAGVDIAFAFERIARTPNTIDAHRLIRYAAEHGRQDDVVELLFRRYFLDGVDIGQIGPLVEVAAEAGLEPGPVREYLVSGRDTEAVRSEDQRARRLGVTGVPCFIVDGRYAVSGAQAPEVFQRVFEMAEQVAASG